MRGLIGWTVGGAALLALGGCSAGVGGATGELYMVEANLADTQGLYLDEALDSRPLTEAQFVGLYGELSPTAIPVQVEILDHVAVAWRRGEDGAVAFSRDSLVAAWRVEGVTAPFAGATPIDGELENMPGGPVYVPGTSIDVGELPGLNETLLEGGDWLIVIDFTNGLDTTIFTEPEVFNDFNNAHPGCA
jgi:hypothetical protein